MPCQFSSCNFAFKIAAKPLQIKNYLSTAHTRTHRRPIKRHYCRPSTTYNLAAILYDWHSGMHNKHSRSYEVVDYRVVWKGLCNILLVKPKFHYADFATKFPTKSIYRRYPTCDVEPYQSDGGSLMYIIVLEPRTGEGNPLRTPCSDCSCEKELWAPPAEQRCKWVSGLWVTASDPLTHDEITAQ